MSGKISVVSISLALLTVLFCSCTQAPDQSFSTLFESPFSADITVVGDGGEYAATLTLAAIDKESDAPRDGNIAYTYPETVCGISAVRVGGEVTVNVCGIELTPSDNIAAKYTVLLDSADIRSSMVERAEFCELDGVECARLCLLDGTEVYIERAGNVPVMIKTDTVTISFTSFTVL